METISLPEAGLCNEEQRERISASTHAAWDREEKQMPFVRISTGGDALTPRQIETLQQQTTDLLHQLLRKRKEVTVVTVQQSPSPIWAAGGRPLAPSMTCAQVDVVITAGTNTDEEKATFIAAMHRLLCEVLGEPSAPVYLMVHELSAAQWGYAGRTQASRRAERHHVA